MSELIALALTAKVFRCALTRVSPLRLLIGAGTGRRALAFTDQVISKIVLKEPHHPVKPESWNPSSHCLWRCFVDFFAIRRRMSWTLVQITSTSIQSHLTQAVVIRYLWYLADWVWETSKHGNGYFEVVNSELLVIWGECEKRNTEYFVVILQQTRDTFVISAEVNVFLWQGNTQRTPLRCLNEGDSDHKKEWTLKKFWQLNIALGYLLGMERVSFQSSYHSWRILSTRMTRWRRPLAKQALLERRRNGTNQQGAVGASFCPGGQTCPHQLIIMGCSSDEQRHDTRWCVEAAWYSVLCLTVE